MLYWQDLQKVTQERATQSPTSRGEIVLTWANVNGTSFLWMNVQPHIPRGSHDLELQVPEGDVSKVTHFGFCNFVIGPQIKAAKTNIQFQDRIVDALGNYYRVLGAYNEAGMSDHYRVALLYLGPTGD